MNAIKATVMQGRLELNVPLDWLDGTEVLIEPTMAPLEKIGIDESEWRDDPESLADWEAWIKTIEPFELTPDEAKRFADPSSAPAPCPPPGSSRSSAGPDRQSD